MREKNVRDIYVRKGPEYSSENYPMPGEEKPHEGNFKNTKTI